MKKTFLTFALAFVSFMANAATLINGIYYELDTSTYTAEVTETPYGSNRYDGDITIPSNITYNGNVFSVTSIGEGAFSDCSGLKSIGIPNSVTSIGNQAFMYCKRLTSVIIPNSVTSIGSRAFGECSGLTSVTIGNSVTSIGGGAFIGCSGLTSVTIPNSVTSIGESAFYGCSGLTSVTIPNSVTSIGDYAFSDCSGLTSVTIGNSVTSIGGGAFNRCSSLTSVTIPNSVKSIGEWAFGFCSGLTSVTIGNSVTSIEYCAFSHCSGLTSVTIPNSVTGLGDYVFEECSGLISATIGNSVTSIGNRAFYDCNRLTSVTIGNSVTSIGNQAFMYCKRLTSVTIPNSVTSIGDDAFYNCTGLTSVTIGNSVTSIGAYAFSDCSGLTSVTIGNSVTSIGEGAFHSCFGLTSVTIGNSVTRIGKTAFCFCEGLTSVTIPNSVRIIEKYAFCNCSGLTSVTIGNNVKSIGESAFEECSGLTSVKSYIVEPFSVKCFDYKTKKNAILYVPVGSIDLYRNTDGWKEFNEIRDFTIKVTAAKISRELTRLHVCVEFTHIEGIESQLDRIVSMKSQGSQLSLQGYTMEGSTAHLYFELPRKEGVYRLRIEASELYEEDFTFDDKELYVIAQSPLTGSKGVEGYTDISFNAFVDDIPLSQISLTSPTGSRADIKSVTLVENGTPTRLRITYKTLEEDGIYHLRIGKGFISSGKEMYYDFESTIELPCADLEPQGIAATESDWTPGQTQTVTYTICNNGTDVTAGECVDVIYMSAYNVVDNDAVEIYRGTNNVWLQPRESLTRSVDVVVPTFVDGEYFLILKTNVSESIKELSYKNNTGFSEKVPVVVEPLNDGNCYFTLNRGESRLFRIPLDTDENIEVLDSYGLSEMYVSTFGMPDTYDAPHTGSATVLNDGLSTVSYLLVRNNSKSETKSQRCHLSTRRFGLDITDVGRENIVKYKTAWIPINVTGCTEIPSFYLVGPSGEKVPCMDIRYKSETEFYAKFNTEELQPGSYSLYVESGELSGIKDNALSVIGNSAQPCLRSNLYLPDSYRVGQSFTARIQYENTGNVDLPIPLLILTGEEGSTYKLEGKEETFTDEIHLAGVNAQSVIGTLMPGEFGSFNVIIDRSNTSATQTTYTLKAITYGCDGIDEPFYLQWLDVDPEDRPICYTEDDWAAYCARLRKNVGDTWETFMEAFGKAAELAYTYDNVNYDARFLYNIIRSNDLEALLVSSSPQNKPKSVPGEVDEVGTIYKYDKVEGWQKLVEPIYDKKGNFLTWERTEVCSQLPSYIGNKYYFISHGMNNSHNEDWIKDMADSLVKIDTKCAVICVDWSKKSRGILPCQAASHINEVVRNTHMALNMAFNGNVNSDISLSNFHLIGHSHGSHVCGRLTRTYKNSMAYRLTSLDESEEIDHWYKDQYLRGERYNAGYVDYYKSSIVCGTEYLVGDDNFILVKKDGDFKNYLLNNPKYDGDRHGYAYKWFTQTINDAEKLGFNWYSRRGSHPKVTGHYGWSGVINGEKMSIDNYLDFGDDEDLRYTEPWYALKYQKKKACEWEFRKALASAFDYKVSEIETKEYIQAGTTESLSTKVANGATNLSIELDDRRSETQKHACHALYVTRKDSSNPTIVSDNNNVTKLRTDINWFFLCSNYDYIPSGNQTSVSFSFNISDKLYKSLGGDGKESIECDFWIVSGVNSSKSYSSNTIWTIDLWDGELLPRDNYKKVTLTVKRPELACSAGNDRLLVLGKNQNTIPVSVNGEVLKGEDLELSYQWKSKGVVFSESKSGSVNLGVGKHPLTFSIEEKVPQSYASHSPSSLGAEDVVVITVKPFIPGDEENKEITPLQSYDPNEKVGFNGVGVNSSVMQGEKMVYSIYFENDAEKAQLAAQKVVVTDTLDTAFDLSTFEFLGTEVANTEIIIPSGKNEITAYTDLRPYNDLILKTEMKLDIDSRVVTVTYTSLDTLTMEPTMDMFAGFLPPNDSTHVGEGHFSYRVKLRDDVADSYEVRNTAHIVFDYNDVISTNTTCHVLDNRIPVSWMDALPAMTEEDSVLVSWSGRDDGSGIRYYDIYRSKNDGPYEMWLRHTPDDSVILHGEVGDKYKFYSIATDYIGFVENDKTEPEATIMFVQGAGVEELTLSGNNVDIYPKVIEDNVNISVKSLNMLGRVSVNIYDLSGKRHLMSVITTDDKSLMRTIDCNSLAQGIYIIEVLVNDTKWSSEKVIKK